MTQKISPFVEGKYGWDLGESGWNGGMDENLLKFSFLFDGNVEGVVPTLPATPVNGEAYFLTSDNRLYFAVEGIWNSVPTPKWSTFKIRTSGVLYRFTGNTVEEVPDTLSMKAEIDTITADVASLGSAAYKDETYFATNPQLDVVSAQAASYTDSLRTDLASPTEGSSIVGRSVVVVESINSLYQISPEDDKVYFVRSYYSNWADFSKSPLGGGFFTYKADEPKSNHNGGSIISPTVLWSGTLASLADFISATGETDPTGNGCFVREEGRAYEAAQWGAVPRSYGDSTVALQNLLSYAETKATSSTEGVSVSLGDLPVKISSTLVVRPGVHFYGNGIRSVIELDNTVDVIAVSMTGGGPPSSIRNLFIRRPDGNGPGTQAGLYITGDGKFVQDVWLSGHFNGLHLQAAGDVSILRALAEYCQYNFRLQNPARVKMTDCVSFLPVVIGCYAYKDANTWANRRLEVKNYSSIGNAGSGRGFKLERLAGYTVDFDDVELEVFAINHSIGVEVVGTKSVKIAANTTTCGTGVSLSSSVNTKLTHISIGDGTGLTATADSIYAQVLPGSEYKNSTTLAMTLASTTNVVGTVFEGSNSYPSINSTTAGHTFLFDGCTFKQSSSTLSLSGSGYTVKVIGCHQVATPPAFSGTATNVRKVFLHNTGDTDSRTISFNRQLVTGTSSPASTVLPDYVGQIYRDTTASTTWLATTLVNTGWVQIA